MMGVWHLLSLGESPGAATAALVYIKRRYELNDVTFFAGDSERRQAKKVSGIVIFTTPEVRYSRLDARGREIVDNPYGSEQGKTLPLGNAQGKITTFEIVRRFIGDEFGAMLAEERGKLYFLEASYHDLDTNLRQMIRAFCALSPPGKTGREVWVNLTGGSNVMNIAALLTTVMSGITGRAYYTYTRDIRLLRPAREADFWYDLPMLKVSFDRDYEAILRVLKEAGGWIESSELLKMVKGKRWQFTATEDTFASDYLNKLDDWLIECGGRSNRLLPAGERFLQLISDEMSRALIYKEPLPQPLKLGDIFEEVPL
jgi:hypothetical protein